MANNDLTRREFVQAGAAATTVGLAAGVSGAGAAKIEPSKILNYNKNMDYRLLGKTGLMVSAVCMGGHWKNLDKMVPGVFKTKSWLSAKLEMPGFRKNRREVVERCMEVGINYIDACTREEVQAYAEATRTKRDKMYLGFSWYQEEMRKKQFRTAKALLKTLEKGMKIAKLDYVDVWRITLLSTSGRHTEAEIEEFVKAITKAKKDGKARFIGCSTHDRPHIKKMIEKYSDVIDVVVTPYTAKTKELPKDSVFETFRKYKVGVFGIKPFAGNSLFKGNGSLKSPHAGRDDRLARMAIRYILHNPAVTAPIPGLINTHQVDNLAKAIMERRELDVAEKRELGEAMNEAWARLPENYQWLKDWEYV